MRLMQKVFIPTIIALLMLCSATASAQFPLRSIEITTGYPSFMHSLEYPWISKSIDMYEHGQRYEEYYQPGINIGYTNQWRKRWEVNVLLNAHLTVMDVFQYPLLPEYADLTPSEVGSSERYDWYATPAFSRQTKVYGAFCVSFRFKWLVRENFSMYSGLGAGVSFHIPLPVPYFAPIGIQFGKGKVFGIVEANISAANTFGMAGIGIRL